MSTGLHIQEQKSFSYIGWLAGLLVVLGLAVCAWYGYLYYTKGIEPPIPIPVANANTNVIEDQVPKATVDNYTVAADEPRYLSIPALDVDKSRILAIGTTDTGELDTPRNIHDTGWYNKSSHPGDGTPAMLLDGHNGGPTKGGVFENIGKLQPGDSIIIERGDGHKFTYLVKQNDSYTVDDMNDHVMKELSQSAELGTQGLNMISCTGNWIPQLQTYDHRQVVRAVLGKQD